MSSQSVPTFGMKPKICEGLFREKSASAITYKINDGSLKRYFTTSDIKFLIGVGIRALIEECWKKNILLVGVVKDSRSRFFYRNFLGAVHVENGVDPAQHLQLHLTDRNIMELLPYLDANIESPWSSIEFDACFLTIHPEHEKGKWKVRGYQSSVTGETTRPERIMLRSICQFFISEDRNNTSHAIFIDRLAYPGWDDNDSHDLILETEKFGKIKALYFEKDINVPRLQRLSMYLLTVLVRNHYPEALGYPDPLHQADWGAKSMKNRVLGLLASSEWAFRSRPLTKTFRQIRDSFR